MEYRISRRSALGALATLAFSVVRGGRAHALEDAAFVRWNDRYEAVIQLEIAQQSGGRARRPYVAVWIENAAGESVRTLGVWVQNRGRGPRWIPDLRRWYRAYRERQAEGIDLLTTVSSATRAAGTYSLVWNGRNDAGAPVEQGEYHVCVEAAREHGTYQLLRKPVAFASRPFRTELGGNAEIGRVAVDFRERSQGA